MAIGGRITISRERLPCKRGRDHLGPRGLCQVLAHGLARIGDVIVAQWSGTDGLQGLQQTVVAHDLLQELVVE